MNNIEDVHAHIDKYIQTNIHKTLHRMTSRVIKSLLFHMLIPLFLVSQVLNTVHSLLIIYINMVHRECRYTILCVMQQSDCAQL